MHLIQNFPGAFSFGKGDRKSLVEKEAEKKPSPNRYMIPSTKTKVAFAIGKAGRHEIKSSTPGVGLYNTYALQDNRIKISIKGMRNESFDNQNPGPGTYQLDSTLKSKQCQFGYKPDKIAPSETPAPNAYQILLTRNNSFNRQQVHFSKGGKDSIYRRTVSPSPDHYNPNYIMMKTSAQSFARSLRDAYYFKQTNPGPASYQQLSKSASKGFSFGNRGSYINNECTPGPGAYYQEVRSKKSISFGSSKKMSQFGNGYRQPGPGSYYFSNQQSRAVTFYTATRNSNDETEAPGPGHYTLPDDWKASAAIIGEKPKVNRQNEVTPGPGSYNIVKSEPDHNFKDTQLGYKGPRSSSIRNDIIGPGAYNINDSNDKAHTFSRNKTSRTPDKTLPYGSVPGPTKYNVESAIGYIPPYLLPK